MMKFLVSALLVALVSGTHYSKREEENFYKVLGEIDNEELYKDLEEEEGELETAKQLYTKNVAEKKCFVEPIELMMPNDEIVEEGDGDEEEMEVETEGPDLSLLPPSLNLHDLGIMHRPIMQGAGCGSCAWVSGVQTLEARVALVSENYMQYSVQNFMNCDHRVCKGTVNYRVWHIARNDPYIVPESEMRYIKKRCNKWEKPCHCGQLMGNYTNVLDQQHVIIGPTIKAETEDNVIAALQHGPLATCLSRGKRRPRPVPVGEECIRGCGHGNSIVGYTKTHLIMQESYGSTWGKFHNGTWMTLRNSICSGNLTEKAFYPLIFLDHDKTNAYYTDVLVDEKALTFVDRLKHNVESDDVRNIGVAKNKCGYLGVACKGVIVLSSGAVELIAAFGGAIDKGSVKAAKKTQMLVYLRHEKSGKYVGITTRKGKVNLKAVAKKTAAPFFTSYGRIISYEHPGYHMVNAKMVPVTKTLAAIDVMNTWLMDDCNLHNSKSGYSLSVVDGLPDSDGTPTQNIGGAVFDKNSIEQRFDVGLSGRWALKSRALNGTELRIRMKVNKALFTKDPDRHRTFYLRWNAGQVLGNLGKPMDETMNWGSGWFKLSDKDKLQVNPTNFLLTKQAARYMSTENPYLGTKGSKIVMTSDETQRWTLERGEI